MRHTKFPPEYSMYYQDSCRLLQAPAGRWYFPTLSPYSVYGCLVPYPVAYPQCICPFLPEELRPHTIPYMFGSLNFRHHATSTTWWISRLQTFLYVQAPILTRPPCCTYRCVSQGSRAVYTTQCTCGCPTCTVVSLHTWIEQLVWLGLSPARLRPCRPLPRDFHP